MMSLPFGLFTQMSGSGPLGPLVSSPGQSPGRAILSGELSCPCDRSCFFFLVFFLFIII